LHEGFTWLRRLLRGRESIFASAPACPYTLPNLKHIEFRLVNLDQPLRWKRPRQIFVCSMCDLFHAAIDAALVDQVFAVMALADRHIFQVLTKRAQRMRDYLSDSAAQKRIAGQVAIFSTRSKEADQVIAALKTSVAIVDNRYWPLPNVAVGVSAEDQQRLEERVRDLISTPAAARFLSCEPLLGPLKMRDWITPVVGHDMETMVRMISWVIVGGESGPGSRPCVVELISSIVSQCKAAGVRVFVKQLGARPVTTNANLLDWPDTVKFYEDASLRGAAASRIALKHRKGGEPAEWPEELRIREPLSI
jgi:protein gp37